MKKRYIIMCSRSSNSTFGACSKPWTPRGKLRLFKNLNTAIATAAKLNVAYGSKNILYGVIPVLASKK